MKLMVLDGNSWSTALFRHQAADGEGWPLTNAISASKYTAFNLLAAHWPDAVIAWDERAPTFRHAATTTATKATRHGMPEAGPANAGFEGLLTDLGFVQVSKAGWEADDILGTLAAACRPRAARRCWLPVTRDSLQLVDDATTVLLATNKETIPMDPAAIRESTASSRRCSSTSKSLMGAMRRTTSPACPASRKNRAGADFEFGGCRRPMTTSTTRPSSRGSAPS